MPSASYGYGEGILSNSLIQLAQRCGHQFYVSFVLGIVDIQEDDYLGSGRAVHQVIEDFYADPISELDQLSFNQEEWLLDRLDDVWRELYDGHFHQDLKDYVNAYDRAIKSTLAYGISKGKSWVAPTLTAYWKENYKQRFDALYESTIAPHLARFPHIIFNRDPVDMYSSARRCLKNFVPIHRDRHHEVIDIQSEVAIEPIEFFGLPISGKIDRLEIAADGSIEIWDYKTGSHEWSISEIANSDQLCWYAHAIKLKYGDLPRIIGIMQLKTGKSIGYALTQEDMDRFYKRQEARIKYVQHILNLIDSADADAVPTLPNPSGSFRSACPCPLAYAEDPKTRCPYYEDKERTRYAEDEHQSTI